MYKDTNYPAAVSEMSDIAAPAIPPSLFDESVAAIDAEYRRLGHTLGWRFLTGPKTTLSPSTKIGFITLNPGGNSEPPDHPRASSEGGSAYLVESWTGHAPGAAPLQFQVQGLFGALARHLGRQASLGPFMSQQILSAHFIPFRSPRFDDLPRRPESIDFAKELWRSILACWQPRLLITIDREAFSAIQPLMLQQPGFRVIDSKRFDTGWGQYQAEAVRLSQPNGLAPVTLARLPHLSTFKLFSREACRPYLERFFAYVTDWASPRM